MERPKRRYSDDDRAEALAILDLQGGNVSEASRLSGVPWQTLAEWRDGRVSSSVPDIRERKKVALSERLEELAHQLIDAMPGKVGDANLRDTAISLGVAVDKALVLRGDPNSITKAIAAGDPRQELLDRLQRLRTAGDGGSDTGRGVAAVAGADRPSVPAVN